MDDDDDVSLGFSSSGAVVDLLRLLFAWDVLMSVAKSILPHNHERPQTQSSSSYTFFY